MCCSETFDIFPVGLRSCIDEVCAFLGERSGVLVRTLRQFTWRKLGTGLITFSALLDREVGGSFPRAWLASSNCAASASLVHTAPDEIGFMEL